MATTKVRVSLWPDRDIEVDEAEIPNLRQQGLLVDAQPDPEPAPQPESQPAPARAKSSKES